MFRIAYIAVALAVLCPQFGAAQEDLLIGTWELREIDEDGEFITLLTTQPNGRFVISGEGKPADSFFGDPEDV